MTTCFLIPSSPLSAPQVPAEKSAHTSAGEKSPGNLPSLLSQPRGEKKKKGACPRSLKVTGRAYKLNSTLIFQQDLSRNS